MSKYGNQKENQEYCTGQEFQVVFVTDMFRLWQCKKCGYEFSQRPVSGDTPPFLAYHPKPIPTHFVVADKKALYQHMVRDVVKQMIERREKLLSELKSTYPRDLETIGKVEHGVMTLLELEHTLRLCDCPDDAYVSPGREA